MGNSDSSCVSKQKADPNANGVGSYKNNEIVGKDVSDKMGKQNVPIPKWMQSDEIPEHCQNLKPEKITVPFEGSKNKWVYVVRDVLSPAECKSLIELSEQNGYIDALVNIGGGLQQKIDSVRNCKRCMIDSHQMADHLYKRIEAFIPKIFGNRRKISFNERLRFLRYHKGEYFAPHHDGVYVRDNKMELSQISVLFYLNDNYKGATTNFLDYNDADKKFAPKITQGMVLMFEHHILHEGAKLLKGTKYIIRTDVMYTYDEVAEEDDDLEVDDEPTVKLNDNNEIS